MSRWSTVALAGALLPFVAFGGPTHAFAFDFQISNAASGGNLSVYFVEGKGPGVPGGSSIMSLDQAVAQGAVKVYQQRSEWSTDAAGHKIQTNGPVVLENLSGQSIFLARCIRERAQPAPEVLTPTVVQPLTSAASRRSLADRAALIRSRRIVPPKEESHALPLAA